MFRSFRPLDIERTVSLSLPLTPQLVERTALAQRGKFHLHAKDRQDGQELSGAELGDLSSLQSQQRFSANASLRGDVLLAKS
jgi:hypothetical protein